MSNPMRENGRLTQYALHCGYVEQKTTDKAQFLTGDLYTDLYHDGCYHVRQFDRRDGAKVFRTMWESFDNYDEAVAFFDKQEGDIHTSSGDV